MSFADPRSALFNQQDLIAYRTEKGVDTLVPGVTGWAQVNGRCELSIAQKVELDDEYLRQRFFLFYIKIVWVTLIKVLVRDDVGH
jgi:O-antigen biosynthesis protein WbqP